MKNQKSCFLKLFAGPVLGAALGGGLLLPAGAARVGEASSEGKAACVSASRPALPIMGWRGIPFDKVTVELYRKAKDAGFTHLMQDAPDVDGSLAVLDKAKAAGIKLSLHAPFLLQANSADAVRRLKKHPALGLYQLGDEPHVKVMPAMGAAARRIMAIDSKHPCYVNWFGVVTSDPMRWYGVPDYRTYVETSRREIPIGLISFDKYPVIVKGDRHPQVPYRDFTDTILKTNWFETLEIVRDVSRKEKVPFWAFSISTAHRVGWSHAYPTATVAEMKLQQYMNLAYGAQGLQYYSYWLASVPGMDIHDGPVKRDGKLTFVFDRVRAVNAELQARAFVFVGADARAVWHTGPDIPVATRPLVPDELPKQVRNLDIKGGAVVSHLVNGSAEYLMVVSRELHRNVYFKTELKEGSRRIRVDGTAAPVDWYDGEYCLSPGDAEIFLLARQ